MNRNTNMHFANTPQVHTKRSKFDESHSIKTTFNVGDIVPIMVDPDILPGDTVQMDMSELIRMATPIYPIMDNLYTDIYWFFVPNRLLWDHWQAFWGENDDPWIQTTEYEIPQIEAPTGGWTEGTIADYMGIPTKVDGISINALPFRAYCKIYNDWFRNENLKSNCHIYTDETTRTGMTGTEIGYDPVTGTEFGGLPMKAAKFHDYFTAALPAPQKGTPVTIPITGTVDVVTGENSNYSLGDNANNLKMSAIKNGKIVKSYQGTANQYQGFLGISPTTTKTEVYDGTMKQANGLGSNHILDENDSPIDGIIPVNLIADMSTMTAVTINELRQAFAIQKYYENAGLHGTRYIEYLRSVFGVTSSDARMQRAEYLGGQRIPLNIDQIVQTSSTDNTSPQGNVAGFSCTHNRKSMFTKSFEEHGILMCLAVTRVEHTYQQGLDRAWSRKKWSDFYNPYFAHLGEQAILEKEIYAQGTSTDETAFGYQEAWADYRYKQNRVTGYMRSNATGSLDVWHFADDYSNAPSLSGAWNDEPYANVDRCIAVTSQLTHQFIADFYFKCAYTRPMPVYSVPGLIDHV